MESWEALLPEAERNFFLQIQRELPAEEVQALRVTAAAFTGTFDAARTGGQLDYELIAGNVHDIRTTSRSPNAMKALYRLGGYDKDTLRHSIRVAVYAERIAQQLGLSDEERDLLWSACMLHDIGKIDVPIEILNIKGKLTNEQFELVKLHTRHGPRLLQGSAPPKVIRIAAQHHERINGSGYPDKLTGDEIEPLAKIVMIADGYEALVSKRPYKEPFPPAKALGILKGDPVEQRFVWALCAAIGESY